jgi:phosphoribosylglycinamide formyltransferase 1
MRERLATLISGGGTTMQEIIKACQSGRVPMDISCVISSNPLAGGIEKAKKLGISERDIIVIDPNNFCNGNKTVDQEEFGKAILKELKARGTTIVTQNGWLPHTPERVIEEYSETIFNQHPGPVPEFGGKGMYGKRVHAARLLFVRETKRNNFTEAIAQRVHKDYDKGHIVKSRQVEIKPEDTVEDLQQRVLPIEHQVQIDLLEDIARGSVRKLPERKISLVRPEEEHVLYEVKKTARLLYPHG